MQYEGKMCAMQNFLKIKLFRFYEQSPTGRLPPAATDVVGSAPSDNNLVFSSPCSWMKMVSSSHREKKTIFTTSCSSMQQNCIHHTEKQPKPIVSVREKKQKGKLSINYFPFRTQSRYHCCLRLSPRWLSDKREPCKIVKMQWKKNLKSQVQCVHVFPYPVFVFL